MRKLNIGAVVRAVVGVVTDIGLVSRAGGFWFGTIVAIGFVAITLGKRYGNWVTQLADLIATACCAINIHRAILLHETPARFRVGRLEWRYILRAIWIALPFGAILFVALILLSFWDAFRQLNFSDPITSMAGTIVIGLIADVLILALALSLPAAAIGRFEFTANKAWDASSGNVLRLVAISIAVLVVPGSMAYLAVDGINSGLTAVGADLPAQLIGIVLKSAIQIMEAVIWAAFLSFSYQGLVEGNPEFAAEAQPQA